MTHVLDALGRIKVTPGIHDHASIVAGGQDLRQIQELEFDDATILTIDGAGDVVRTQVYHAIAANAGVVDDLDHATGGIEGDLLIIRPDAGDTITCRHDQGGAGDFWFAGAADIVLDNQDHLLLVHDGTSWCDVSGGAGGGGTLDDAYDFGGAGVGRTITADAGAVQLDGAGGLGTQGNIVLDDGVGDSPQAQFVNQANEIAYIQHQNDGDFTVRLGGNDGGYQFVVETLAGTHLLTLNALGNAYVNVGGIYADDLSQITVEHDAEDTVAEILRLCLTCFGGGVPAAGFGGRLTWRLDDSASTLEDAGYVDVVFSDATHGSEDTYMPFSVRIAGAAPAEVSRVDGIGLLTASGHTNAGDAQAFIVKNTSGGAVVANAVGYIDENGEFKTTATAYLNVPWCVVVRGGANNADIYVAKRGRVTVTLNGNCAIGDKLYTSTTAGQAQPLTYVQPGLFATALTANVAGAGGACEALLMCHAKPMPYTNANDILHITTSSDSQFAADINGAPVGAVLTYDTIVGNEDSIVPTLAAQVGKLELINTTKVPDEIALISSVNTGANQITVTNAVDIAGWLNNEKIQVNSTTCIIAGPPYYFNVNCSGFLPSNAVAIALQVVANDGAGYAQVRIHGFEVWAASKEAAVMSQNAYYNFGFPHIPVIDQKICYWLNASGAATGEAYLRIQGYTEMVP